MHDYDPFLTQPQPSNPWISEETSLWTLNADKYKLENMLICEISKENKTT